jgi:hypothetical protein
MASAPTAAARAARAIRRGQSRRCFTRWPPCGRAAVPAGAPRCC